MVNNPEESEPRQWKTKSGEEWTELSRREVQYRDRFALDDAEFRRRWEGRFRQVFQLPPRLADLDPEEEWPQLPDPIFREEYLLAFPTHKDIRDFDPFIQFVHATGDEEFALLTSLRVTGRLCRAFPSSIDRKTFLEEGESESPGWIGVMNHFVTGSTARWGFYFAERRDVLIAGVADEKLLTALQNAYDFEGRNLELVDQFGRKGFDELSLQQTLKLHALAAEIREGKR
jgi:hypothetical protein